MHLGDSFKCLTRGHRSSIAVVTSGRASVLAGTRCQIALQVGFWSREANTLLPLHITGRSREAGFGRGLICLDLATARVHKPAEPGLKASIVFRPGNQL